MVKDRDGKETNELHERNILVTPSFHFHSIFRCFRGEWTNKTNEEMLKCLIYDGGRSDEDFESPSLVFIIVADRRVIVISGILPQIVCDIRFEFVGVIEEEICHERFAPNTGEPCFEDLMPLEDDPGGELSETIDVSLLFYADDDVC